MSFLSDPIDGDLLG